MPEVSAALAEWLLATADDQLILAHRASEWTGRAPMLEEDIALANIAQDELGHATLWYGLLGELLGKPPEYADELVFMRGAASWRNAQLVELPNGDWAHTMLRQYLMDVYEQVALAALVGSCHEGVAAIAATIRREELYHFKHSSAWVKRLGLGTAESRRRMQQALDQQWPYVAQLFVPFSVDAILVEAGYTPNPETLAEAWQAQVLPLLHLCELDVPTLEATAVSRQKHTPHLDELLADMQAVARLDPQAEW